jgi:hypothetical protein
MEILLFILAAAALFGLSLWSGYRRAKQVYELSQHGLPVTGTITRRWKRQGKVRRPFLSYSYSVAGQTYKHTMALSSDEYLTYAEGQLIELRYLPNKPEISATEKIVEQSRQAGIDLAAKKKKP